MYRLARLLVLVPPGVLTTRCTVPLECRGTRIRSRVDDSSMTDRATAEPKRTVVPGTKPAPVIRIVWPPVARPLEADSAVTRGLLR